MRDDIHILLDSVSVMCETELKDDSRCHEIKLVCRLGDDHWRDGEKSLEEMFEEVKETDILPKTSQPPIGEFTQIYKKLVEEGKKVISIHTSSTLSGTYQTACLAAKDVCKEIKNADIRVFDSKSAGPVISNMAIAVLKKIDEGASMDEVASYTKDVIERSETFFTVATLEYLKKGGRIGAVNSLFGNLLSIKPIIHLNDGELVVEDKVRTMKKAIMKMAELTKEYAPFESIAIAHAADIKKGDFLKEIVEKMYPGVPILYTGMGTVLAAHLGPGIVGVCPRRKK